MNENINLTKILKYCPKGYKLYTPLYGEVEFEGIIYGKFPIVVTDEFRNIYFTEKGLYYDAPNAECLLFPSKEQRDWSKFTAPWYKKEMDTIARIENQGEKAPSQTNERAWLYLVSDVLTWKYGIGQYLDDPRVQELAKRLCSEYSQKLYNPSILSNSSNTGKNKQKFADKIEPRFKVGDWVVNKFGDSWHIDSFDKKNYQVSDGKGNYNYFPISKQDEMQLWTIKDGKDGDVLSFYCEYKSNKMVQVGIIEKYVGKHGGCSNTFKIYVGVNWDNNLQMGKYMGCSINIGCSDIHPATKEQRDHLFQIIKEAGYKWIVETKTLEKLVQPKFKVGDMIRHKKTNKDDVYEINKVYDDSYGIAGFTWMIYMKYQDQYELVPNKFDPKTLKPFDKVLVRDDETCIWKADFYSHKGESRTHPFKCVNLIYKCCIPYNEDTKHLVGTKEEAPECYRYWED